MDGTCINIGPRIDEDADILFGGKVGGDTGTLNTLESAKFDGGGGDSRTGMTRADDGIGVAFLDQIDGGDR